MENTAGITILAGHFGSGKTNLALNLTSLASAGNIGKVAAIDLDIINPYFRFSALARSQRLKEALRENVRVFAPVFAETNLDVPALPAEIGAVFSTPAYDFVIVDVGGDESGAIALGQYSDNIKKRGYRMLFVVNKYRPFTSSGAETLDMLSMIESAGKLKFTGIAANPNLGAHTDADTVLDSLEFYLDLSEKTGLELSFISVEKSLVPHVKKAVQIGLSPSLKEISRIPILGIEVFTKPGWEISNKNSGSILQI